MRTAEISKRFLEYFSEHGHLTVPSSSLISPNPTTLFTIAGMVPFGVGVFFSLPKITLPFSSKSIGIYFFILYPFK